MTNPTVTVLLPGVLYTVLSCTLWSKIFSNFVFEYFYQLQDWDDIHNKKEGSKNSWHTTFKEPMTLS